MVVGGWAEGERGVGWSGGEGLGGAGERGDSPNLTGNPAGICSEMKSLICAKCELFSACQNREHRCTYVMCSILHIYILNTPVTCLYSAHHEVDDGHNLLL